MLLCSKSEINKAMKSVPPVEPSVFNAVTVTKPYKKPPKAIFNKISSNKGWKSNIVKNKDVHENWMQDKNVNRFEIRFAQNKAHGIFKARIKNDVDRFMPNNCEILLMSNARPVNPLDNKLHGFMKVWITNV